MKKTFLIPEKSVDHDVQQIIFQAISDTETITRVVIGRKDSGTNEPFQYTPTTILLSKAIDESLKSRAISNDDIAGFNNCLKAIISKTLNIDLDDAKDMFLIKSNEISK